MNGRVYSPVLSAFLSVDTLNQMVADTQSGNGYATPAATLYGTSTRPEAGFSGTSGTLSRHHSEQPVKHLVLPGMGSSISRVKRASGLLRIGA
jgi:hypothetical protein